jgi:predicted phosphodiesterase
MRLAIISDIHGNAYALDVALADIAAQGVDQIVCLGDAIQGGAQPAETVQRLRDLRCPVVMGNADAWLLTGHETGHEGVTPVQEAVRQWSLAQLSAADRAFIAAFPPTVRVAVTATDALQCFHGSPASFDDIILPTMPDADVWPYFQGHDARWFTGGHTHLQQLRHINDGFFFNPGSIGVTYRRHQPDDDAVRLAPWAEYAILSVTPTMVSVEFRQAPITVARLLEIVEHSGRPHWERLREEYGESGRLGTSSRAPAP